MSKKNTGSASHDKAIKDYLEELLQEVPEDELETVPVTSAPISEPVVSTPDVVVPPHQEPVDVPPVVGLQQLVAEVPDVIEKTQIAIELAQDMAQQQQVVTSANYDDTVPDWAQSRFQCLLFKVSGLSLAVPLVKLNNVIPWDNNITHTPNQTDWYLGLVKYLENQVKIIDTALLVMPENRREKIETPAEQRFSHILMVDNRRWGLACDSIGDVIWLEKKDVKWRKDKRTRAWLSGTSLEHLCAVMDTEVFAEMLNKDR